MPMWARAGVILLGAFLLILGIAKTYFEIKAWEVLVQAGQRALEVGGDYRVHIRLYVFISALGLTFVLLGCLI